MLDQTISKNNHAYQFRVDVLTDISDYKIKIAEMLTQEEFSDWICCLEIGDKSKKLHYQCIIWNKKLLSTKQRNTIKAKYFRINRDSKNSISFTDAKKIYNLASYVLKENNLENESHIITTLSPERRNLIPKWLSKNAIKSKWKQDLEDEILLIVSLDCFGRYPSIYDTVSKIITFYIEQEHPPPNRQMLYKHLLKYHPEYTITDYINSINIFPNM